MFSSLTAGVSGLENYQQEMDVIGNNIANVNTTGFKASTVDFADAFSNTLGTSGSGTDIQVGTGVGISAINNNWGQGAMETTGVNTNVAITANGFFQVKDPVTGAIFATRDGNFKEDASGNLITDAGDYVQGFTSYTGGVGSTPGNIQINTKGSTSTAGIASFSIDSQGRINVVQSDGTTSVSGQITLQNYQDPQMLVNQGDNTYSNLTAAGPLSASVAPGSGGTGALQSGALEISNVDLSNEMANLITAQRAFEANSKIITTANEVLQTVVNMKQN